MTAAALLYRLTAIASAAIGLTGAAAWLRPRARWARTGLTAARRSDDRAIRGDEGAAVSRPEPAPPAPPAGASSAPPAAPTKSRSTVSIAAITLAGTALTALAFAAFVARWREAGHLPIFGTYESALSLAVAVLAAGCLWEVRGSAGGALPLSALMAAALLAHGLGFDPTVYALTISERSLVVDLHAIAAWSAFGVLAANAAVAGRILLARAGSPAETGPALGRTLELGFVLHSAMMATGCFYKFLLFGNAWSWDPIEVLGLVAWLSYGALLHMHRFAAWRGRQLARYCVLVFVVLVASYRLIVYFPPWASFHILDVDRREHLMSSPAGGPR